MTDLQVLALGIACVLVFAGDLAVCRWVRE